MSNTCSNPLCKTPVVTHPRAIHPRRFCSNECKLDTWALRQAAKLLLSLGLVTGWEVLEGLKGGGSEDKVGAEIVRCEPV